MKENNLHFRKALGIIGMILFVFFTFQKAYSQCSPGQTLLNQTITFTNPALAVPTNAFNFNIPAGSNVVSATISISAFGDLDGTGGNLERWDVTGETGGVLGSVGASGNFSDQCATTFNSGAIMLNAADVTNWAANGTITFTGTDAGGNINPTLCGGDFLSVTLTLCYGAAAPPPPAAEITHPFNTTVNFEVACGTALTSYYDNGGPDCDGTGGEYLNNSNGVAIICPDAANAGQPITLEFLDVDVEIRFTAPCWDFLNIYDGMGTGGTQLFSGCGEEGFDTCAGGFPGDGGDGGGVEGGPNDINASASNTPANTNNVWTSSDASGCLTVEFTSDTSVQEGGWVATLGCTQLVPPGCDIVCPATISVPCEGGADPAITGTPLTGVDCVLTYSDETVGCVITRTWTSTSQTGASSSCVQTIILIDNTAPTVTCPAGQTLTCFETVPAPATTAAGFVALGGSIADNCTTDLGDFTVFSQDANNGGNNCPGNARTVTRTYYVVDACSNTTTCTQTFTYLASNQGPVITSVLPTCYKYCESLLNPAATDVTYTTDCSFGAVVNVAGPTQIGATNCPGTIYRFTYTVTDDCGRTSAPVTRDFVIGNDGPTINCPPFNLFLECGDENNAQYLEDHFATVTVNTSCELGYTLTHFPQNFNNIACASSTVVTFIATDACGRTASCTTTVAIQDNTPPTIVSVPPSVCDITNCSADVNFWFNHWKNYMINGIVAEDACDSDVSIQAVNTPLNTDCPNGDAETVVTFTATDNCGNVSEITGTFIVLATPTNLTLGGKVATEVAESVESVEVTLSGSNIANQMVETDVDGIYGFTDLAAGDNYTITPYSNDNPLNGVSSYDLVLISQHILQTQALDSPYKMIAADINRSGSITTTDLLELRKLILHITEEFPNNTSWRFVEADFVFPQSTNPFATLFPEAVYINGLTESDLHDFVGVKIGDVNDSAIPNAFAGGEDRTTTGDLVFEVKDQQLEAGQTYEVAFRADNFESIHGYQFTLNYDNNALTFEGLRAGDLTDMTESNFGLTKLDDGVITTSWTHQTAQSLSRDAAVFYITFTANADVLLSEALAVSSRYTKAEAYNSDLNLLDVQFRFDTEDVVTKDFRLYQNVPNPFKQETVIGFELPEAAAVTLNIYDGSGRLLKQIEGDFNKGYNNVTLSNEDLSPGLLHYQLVTPMGALTKKMILQ